jgi:hypothetical protein
VEGGSLDKKLRGTAVPPRQAAGIVETLARAIEAAHQAGVVHRDLKPANVLVGKQWALKVTDFGLAKRLDEDSGQTHTGAVMGTPSYMAPEQAAGKTGEIGPAADVYALGAILYELLTGRPPFKGATRRETLDQVLSRAPVPPRRAQPTVPRDVETICLKCLRKEAAGRYASAEALADDLRRFRECKPILARPTGRLEKVAKWARRNPVGAALLVVLVVATGVSVGFGVSAAYQAEVARGKTAEAAKTKGELAGTITQLEESKTHLEMSEVRSLLGPLGLRSGPLIDPEIKNLWDLAATRDERLGHRLLKEALLSPETTRQLKGRAEPALHAIVRLDPDRRAQAERLLVERLEDSELSVEQREDVVLLAVALGDLSPPAAARVARALTQAMARTDDRDVLLTLARGLSAVAARLGPEDATRAADALVQAQGKAHFQDTVLAEGLSAVAARMPPKEAAATLTSALCKTHDPAALRLWTQALSAVADRLEPGEAAQPAATLIQAMARTNDSDARLAWIRGLSALADHMGPREAAQVAAILIEAIARTPDPEEARSLAQGLSAVANRMEPADATRACTQAAATLTQAIARTPYLGHAQSLAQGLSAVAARVGPKEAAQAAKRLIQVIAQGQFDRDAWSRLAEALSALAARMEPREAAATLTQAMAMIDFGHDFDPRALARGLLAVADRLEPGEAARVRAGAAITLAEGAAKCRQHAVLAGALSIVADRLAPDEAARACATLIRAMDKAKATRSFDQRAYADCLSALAVRCDPEGAARAANALALLITELDAPFHLPALGQLLSAVVVRMEPEQAAATLTRALVKASNPEAQSRLAESLSLVAAHLKPQDASRAADALTQAMPNAWGSLDAHRIILQSLSAVAARLGPEDAARTAAALTEALAQKRSLFPSPAFAEVLPEFAQALSAVAGRMGRVQAAQLCARAAEALLQTMDNKPTNVYGMHQLAQAVAAVAERMEPADAARVRARAAETVLQAMPRILGYSDGLHRSAQVLLAVADRMEPRDAARVRARAAETITSCMGNPPRLDPSGTPNYVPFCRALSAVTDRMAPAEGARVCARAAEIISQAMARTSDPAGLPSFSQGLSMLAARMGPGEAARVRARVAGALTLAMGKTTDPNALQALARELSATADCMGSEDAARACAPAAAVLAQDMAKAGSPDALPQLAESLSAVLTWGGRPELSRWSGAVLAAIGTLARPDQPVSALAALGPALQPPPCRLSTPELVELLKQPTCFGPARRVILDQLEHRYRRPFADHWAFVRFAQEHNLGLDFTSAPRRPAVGAGSEGK